MSQTKVDYSLIIEKVSKAPKGIDMRKLSYTITQVPIVQFLTKMFEYEIISPYCHVCSFENNGSRIYLKKTILQCNQSTHLLIQCIRQILRFTSKAIPFKISKNNINYNSHKKETKVTCQLRLVINNEQAFMIREKLAQLYTLKTNRAIIKFTEIWCV